MLLQVQVVPAAVGTEVGQRQFRYYPAMPGNSTCQVKEKEQLQKRIQSRRYFADAEDLVCPVTSVSALMESHGIQRIDLMKVCKLCSADACFASCQALFSTLAVTLLASEYCVCVDGEPWH